MAETIISDFSDNIDGGIAWFIWMLFVVSGLLYLGLWGFNERSVRAVMVFSLFGLMMVISLWFTNFEFFRIEDSFKESAMWWFAGMAIWYPLARLGSNTESMTLFSLVTPEEFQVLSTLAADLPIFWSWFITGIVAPIVEEAFWTVGLPIALLIILESLGEEYPIFNNPFVQIPIVWVIVVTSFAFFHIPQAVAAFIIAAITFRTVITGLYWTDNRYLDIPGVTVIPIFALGAHMGNNIGAQGNITHTLNVLSSSWWGLITGLVLLLFILVALDGFWDEIKKRTPLGN